MRSGKSWAIAARTAAVLKAGGRAVVMRSTGGTMEGDEIVGVPGFDDGRQLSGRIAALAAPEVPRPVIDMLDIVAEAHAALYAGLDIALSSDSTAYSKVVFAGGKLEFHPISAKEFYALEAPDEPA